MRRTAISVTQSVQGAELGTWQQSQRPALRYGVAPFVKGREDIEVLFRQPDLLAHPAPIEISGYGVENILRKAGVLELELARDGVSRNFSGFVRDHQPVVSFPPDLVWLAHHSGVEITWKDSIKRTLPVSSLSLTTESAESVAGRICSEVTASPQKYDVWRRLTARDHDTGLTYSRLLIEYAITAATRARARAFAGIVPIVDGESRGSASLLQRWNVAFADVVRDRLNDGVTTPAFLYTVNMNPGVFVPDTPSTTLDAVVGNTRAALSGELADYFDGIHLTIRGLYRLSLNAGRTNVVKDFVRRLAAVAHDGGVPLWWSRPGVIGLAGHDLGSSFTSHSLNLGIEDVYQEPGGGGALPQMCGKVLNPTARAYWGYNQVVRAIAGPDCGLPDLGLSKAAPSDIELMSAARYRINFSKPYNVSAFRYLWSDWCAHLRTGETTPGTEYLQSFESPFNQWGPL